MSLTEIAAHDPSVGVRRRHLPIRMGRNHEKPGFSTARKTMTIMSSVGTSFHQR